MKLATLRGTLSQLKSPFRQEDREDSNAGERLYWKNPRENACSTGPPTVGQAAKTIAKALQVVFLVGSNAKPAL